MTTLHARGQFDGAVLVAAGDTVVYRRAFGRADDEARVPFTPATPSCVASVSKPFTAVDDLYAWDRALFSGRLVRRATLDEAFTPGPVRGGTTTYGLGWNVTGEGSERHVWHTGNTAGFRALVDHRLADGSAVILLTNHGNSRRVEIDSAIRRILAGRPYSLPKRSVAERLYPVARDSGGAAALRAYAALRAAGDTTYDYGEGELNALSYQLLGAAKPADAVAIFRQNAREHPASSNAFDSLAEALGRAGDRAAAIAGYREALRLDSTNVHAATMLRRLSGGT